MPDGKTWFAQDLNYTKDLTYNAYPYEANGKQVTSNENGAQAIGSYWCPGAHGATYSGDQNMCNVYGALYTWETTMMLDGKYADESKTSSAWDESWVSPYYYNTGTPATNPHADKNNARGGTTAKNGGRGICPMGWHIPTDLEWALLFDSVDGDGTGSQFVNLVPSVTSVGGTDAHTKLKSVASYTDTDDGTGKWLSNYEGTDTYGFRALPSGQVVPKWGKYDARGATAQWTSSTMISTSVTTAYYIGRYTKATTHHAGDRITGVSLRCLKD
jgi:uncharacterized protein (TIGR02145 family)